MAALGCLTRATVGGVLPAAVAARRGRKGARVQEDGDGLGSGMVLAYVSEFTFGPSTYYYWQESSRAQFRCCRLIKL
jgi:hypothetical protein